LNTTLVKSNKSKQTPKNREEELLKKSSSRTSIGSEEMYRKHLTMKPKPKESSFCLVQIGSLSAQNTLNLNEMPLFSRIA